jgi:hypothetical protein
LHGMRRSYERDVDGRQGAGDCLGKRASDLSGEARARRDKDQLDDGVHVSRRESPEGRPQRGKGRSCCGAHYERGSCRWITVVVHQHEPVGPGRFHEDLAGQAIAVDNDHVVRSGWDQTVWQWRPSDAVAFERCVRAVCVATRLDPLAAQSDRDGGRPAHVPEAGFLTRIGDEDHRIHDCQIVL